MKTLRCRCRIWLSGFSLILLTALSASAATLTVNSAADAGGTCPGTSCTLRQAIVTAAAGDTVDFAAGIATINLTSGELLINKNLLISGPGAKLLSVQGGAASDTGYFRIFEIAASVNVTLSGLTIAGGNPFFQDGGGGGIYNAGTLTVANATISGNSPSNFGGGIRNIGMVTITNSSISDNIDGDGIYNDPGGTVNLSNSTISGNPYGGIDSYGTTLNLNNSTISGNVGGGVYNYDGTATVTGCTIVGNGNSTDGYGGIANYSSVAVSVGNTIIANNLSATMDPDVQAHVNSQGYNLIGIASSNTTITGITTGNQLGTAVSPINPMLGPLQDNGGPTFTRALLSGSPAIETGHSLGSNTDQRGFARPVDSPLFANASGGDGSDIGAYEVQADVLPGCSGINRIVNNSSDSGVGSLRDVLANVCAGSTITFAPSVTHVSLTSAELLIDKSLTINGPGANLLSVERAAIGAAGNFRIFEVTGNVRVTISGLTIAFGTNPGGNGGGIEIADASTLALTGVAISGNTALGGNGGGIHNGFGTLIIANSTISGNSVSHSIFASSGGGIFNHGGTLTIVSSTLSGNSAIGPGGNSDSGGGIISNQGTVTITDSTLTGNSGDLGGGIRGVNGATVISRNTIIALNTSASGPDINGPLTSQGFNLIGDYTGASISPVQFSDQLGVTQAQLNLGPLQYNGGSTQTHALLTGSVAIDKGNSSGSTTDQRGFARPSGSAGVAGGDGSDIGAFEVDTIFRNGFDP